MNRLASRIVAAALAFAGTAAAAQDAPRLGQVLQDRRPARGETVAKLTPLPKKDWSFARGEYRSAISGVALRLPQVAGEKVVSVREAVGTRTPDGQVANSHLLFVPGADGAKVGRNGPVSALVVTPLRGEAPRDRETLLKGLEPVGAERKKMESRGIEFRRVPAASGEALERIQPNRFIASAFPYRTTVDETADRIGSMGVTRYVVWRDQAVLEFTQVLPCGTLAPDACKDAARQAADRFVQGLVAYEPVKTSNKAK